MGGDTEDELRKKRLAGKKPHRGSGKKRKKQNEEDGEDGEVGEVGDRKSGGGATIIDDDRSGEKERCKKQQSLLKGNPENEAKGGIGGVVEGGIEGSTFGAGEPREWTVSVALPSSIISNTQTPLLRAHLVGQIGRTLTIFGVDEVVIYDDAADSDGVPKDSPVFGRRHDAAKRPESAVTGISRWASFFVKNLQYLETPQYLRKALFDFDEDLQYAGLEHPLDAPHHLRRHEWLPYREGVVKSVNSTTKTSAVDCGLGQHFTVRRILPEGSRVTVKLPPDTKKWVETPVMRQQRVDGLRVCEVVPPIEPVRKLGLYWGYRVRTAKSVREVRESLPFVLRREGTSREKIREGYDFIVGTSDKGQLADDETFSLGKRFRHALIVFGGVAGLEAVIDGSKRVEESMFDLYINTCRNQSSRTIRTEEALMITLALLRPHILSN